MSFTGSWIWLSERMKPCHRAKNTAQNMTTLRHFALNIVKQDADRKLGIANSRKRAGWDRNYLIKLLTTADR